MKKQFVILNGDKIMFIQKHTLDEATTIAQNICDNSKEIIVREIDFTIISKTINNFSSHEVSDDGIINYMNNILLNDFIN